ncbi:MAG: hypothetical protein HY820_30810 [Acidobacteria bacterium]|nr:hypothetical protein [Acidobacteriota bacterium]
MDIVQSSMEGLLRAEAAVGRAANRIAGMPLSLNGEPEDIVDLSAEAVALMVARNSHSANIKAAEAGQELAKSTLDLLG